MTRSRVCAIRSSATLRVSDIRNYIRRGKLWEAFTAPERPVLLIDEIDKADIEFPNDLLLELDRMEFYVYETGETIKAERRPIVVITSNNEKELPDAFLRRCFFHYIRFPDTETMQRIVEAHFPGIKGRLIEDALKQFFAVRETPGLKKKPTTSELLDWLKLLVSDDVSAETLRERDPRKLIPPLHGALAEERAGRASVRAARLPQPARARHLNATREALASRGALPVDLADETSAPPASLQSGARIGARRFRARADVGRAGRRAPHRQAHRRARPRSGPRGLFQRQTHPRNRRTGRRRLAPQSQVDRRKRALRGDAPTDPDAAALAARKRALRDDRRPQSRHRRDRKPAHRLGRRGRPGAHGLEISDVGPCRNRVLRRRLGRISSRARAA